jgi:acyl carrier protein
MGLTREQVLEKVKAMVVDQVGCEDEEVTEESSWIEDLGADSLDVVELIMAFEDAFDVNIIDEDAEQLTTIKAAVDHIHKLLG